MAQPPAYLHELPRRSLVALPPAAYLHHSDETLRKIADDFDIRGKRRVFYERSFWLSYRYGVNKWIEDDLLHVTHAKKLYKKSLINALRFVEGADEIFTSRPMLSLWFDASRSPVNASSFCDSAEISKRFDEREMISQVYYFLLLTAKCLAELPALPPSRKRRLALRKWAHGHLEFWTQELKRSVTVINDSKDGYSECQRFLRSLLQEIDPESVPKLGTIVRQYRTEQRVESPRL